MSVQDRTSHKRSADALFRPSVYPIDRLFVQFSEKHKRAQKQLRPATYALMEDIPIRRSTTLTRVVTYAGVDYHKKFSVVTLGDAAGKVLRTERVPNDEHAIRQFFSDHKSIQCAVESCRGYEWFVDLLKEIGQTVHVANPYEVALIAKSRCKTDKVDSRILMELLAMGFLPTCYQPTAIERKLRERLRWRCQLVRNTTRIKVRIHSLLDKENVGLSLGSTIFKGRGRKMLEELELQGPGRQELLNKHLKLLEHFEKLVEAEDK